ncbi:MAG: hypothetical protein K6L76_10515 [Agarilytica sp.]
MLKLLFACATIALFSGCASNTYQYGTGKHGSTNKAPVIHQQVYQGAPSPILDASDWYWPPSLIAKLFLWNKNIDSHEVSQETIDELLLYLDKNDLDDVQVLVNTYKPGLQFSRLFKNREVGAGWRYTLGLLSTSLYAVLPGRFFGGDHYNPYTNTISIYSDDPAIAIHEGGHAKDFNSRRWKGLNAALYMLPGAALYYEAVATSDALSYLQWECRYNEEKDAYKTLHPAYGTYIGGLAHTVTGGVLIGAIPGHITGAIGAANVEENPACELKD